MALNEQLRVDIASGGGSQLQITPHELTDPSGFVRASFASLGAPYVYLRLYPPVLAMLRATIGSVCQLGVRSETVTGEAVLFRGTDTASTAKLVSGGLGVEYAGLTFDADGQPVEVSITADASGGLRASKAFYGAAICSYTSEYRLLKYSYEVTALTGGGARITGGSVLAFYGGQVASYDLPAPDLPQAQPDLAELYRIVSYTILQKESEYEKPPGWPDSGGYPAYGLPVSAGPDPDKDWIQSERVHEIGWIDGYCRLSTHRNPIQPAKPFVGSTSYKIPTETKMTDDSTLQQQGFSLACIAQAHQQLQDREG